MRVGKNENQQTEVLADISPFWIGIERCADGGIDVGRNFRHAGRILSISQSERRVDLL